MTGITYPPELLPAADSDDEIEIVIDGIAYSPDEAERRFLSGGSSLPALPRELARQLAISSGLHQSADR